MAKERKPLVIADKAYVTLETSSFKAAMDDIKLPALYKAAAYGRAIMRSLFKKRKSISPPGQPPHSHVGLLRGKTAFAVDRQRMTATIGPLALATDSYDVRSNKTMPQLLNEGGSATALRNGKRKRVKYRARPFVARTYSATVPKLTEFMQR